MNPDTANLGDIVMTTEDDGTTYTDYTAMAEHFALPNYTRQTAPPNTEATIIAITPHFQVEYLGNVVAIDMAGDQYLVTEKSLIKVREVHKITIDEGMFTI